MQRAAEKCIEHDPAKQHCTRWERACSKASDQTTSMLNVPTSSRAGSLPHWKSWCIFRRRTSQSASSAVPAPPSPPASCRRYSAPATTRTR
ncbi:hypothetical protein EGJ53_25120 [Pseudomonas fluorescens]|nr:hypothetical protein EGJ53_25120 [Pseudomonas fluorescens]